MKTKINLFSAIIILFTTLVYESCIQKDRQETKKGIGNRAAEDYHTSLPHSSLPAK
ncbi:hypothetical protein [Pedobacter chinensis]|uniref:hypothetical protein n=1 Tax=Pedobacter chinensis TaxID=2282421 RepID=UPI001314D80B|nr:hypothetical protein [Pedobacter chinensis]